MCGIYRRHYAVSGCHSNEFSSADNLHEYKLLAKIASVARDTIRNEGTR
jgi:hypothetical protein